MGILSLKISLICVSVSVWRVAENNEVILVTRKSFENDKCYYEPSTAKEQGQSELLLQDNNPWSSLEIAFGRRLALNGRNRIVRCTGYFTHNRAASKLEMLAMLTVSTNFPPSSNTKAFEDPLRKEAS